MGIFYSISVSENAYRIKKKIKNIIYELHENLHTKVLSKNSLSVFLIEQSDEADFVSFINRLNDEQIIFKVITDLDLPDVINCNKTHEFIPLLDLERNVKNELSLDKDLSYNNINFHEDDIRMVESLLKALFYNLYDDNLSYDRAFLYAMSYVSGKSLRTKSANKNMICDSLVYSCLKNWYEKYYKYKKSIYNSYHNYFESVKQILEDTSISYLSTIEPLKSYPLTKKFSYYIEDFIREIKNKRYGIKSYEKFLIKELMLSYRTPKYQETDYNKIFILARQMIDDTKILLTIINYWTILYNIQQIERNNMVSNIIIYTKQNFNNHLLFALDDMGFSDF